MSFPVPLVAATKLKESKSSIEQETIKTHVDRKKNSPKSPHENRHRTLVRPPANPRVPTRRIDTNNEPLTA